MEGLDLLKKEWRKQDASLPKYKKTDLYQMLRKRSASMVKWIFYISIIEFVFWTVFNILYSFTDNAHEVEKIIDLTWVNRISYVVSYTVLFYFMYRFYKNYRLIKSDDSIRGLMDAILNTRKTVKYYVWANIGFFVLTFIVVTILIYNTGGLKGQEHVPSYIFFAAMAISLVVIVGLLLLFYRLIYGILTRRLKKNYKTLEKFEE